MTNCPCGKCEKKGCGAYHDHCETYLKWRNNFIKPNETQFVIHTQTDINRYYATKKR